MVALEERIDSRTEADQVYGRIPCRFGNEVRYLPTMKIGPVRAWKRTLAESASRLAGLDLREGEQAISDLTLFASGATDEVLDLVLAYDTTGALGGRDWLEAHADDRELYVVLRSILAVHFPFVEDVRQAMEVLGSLFAVRTSATLPTPELVEPE